MISWGRVTKGTFWNNDEPPHLLPASLPPLSLTLLQAWEQDPKGETVWGLCVAPALGEAAWGRHAEETRAAAVGSLLAVCCVPPPPEPPQRLWLWQLPGKEGSSIFHVWHILKQNNNPEILWTLTGGRRE